MGGGAYYNNFMSDKYTLLYYDLGQNFAEDLDMPELLAWPAVLFLYLWSFLSKSPLQRIVQKINIWNNFLLLQWHTMNISE